MKIDRLLGIITMLLNNEKTTAKIHDIQLSCSLCYTDVSKAISDKNQNGERRRGVLDDQGLRKLKNN